VTATPDTPSPAQLARPTASSDSFPTPTASPTPTPAATPEPAPLAMREIAGIDFALVPGRSDLRIEASLSRDEAEAVAATVAADIPAVEREFERTLVPGGEWRLLRVRYEAASMATTGSLIPLNTIVSQLAWNALTDWAGYFKYQESARAVELLREDVGGNAPIARIYERLRRGQNL